MIIFYYLIMIMKGQVIIYNDQHCACSELGSTSCEILHDYCQMVSGVCVEKPIKCALNAQANCTKIKTNYKCDWVDGNCIDNEYKCSTFTTNTTSTTCSWDLGCYWNNQNKCEEFSKCSNYSPDFCPFTEECIIDSGECVNISYRQCSSIANMTDCFGVASPTSTCFWNTKNKVCKEIENNPDCSDLSDFQQLCRYHDCQYDSKTNICSFIDCSFYTLNSACKTARISTTSSKLCFWSNNICQEAQDTNHLTSSSCFQATLYNYKWTDKCEKCLDLISYNQNNVGIQIKILILLCLMSI